VGFPSNCGAIAPPQNVLFFSEPVDPEGIFSFPEKLRYSFLCWRGSLPLASIALLHSLYFAGFFFPHDHLSLLLLPFFFFSPCSINLSKGSPTPTQQEERSRPAYFILWHRGSPVEPPSSPSLSLLYPYHARGVLFFLSPSPVPPIRDTAPFPLTRPGRYAILSPSGEKLILAFFFFSSPLLKIDILYQPPSSPYFMIESPANSVFSLLLPS